MKATLVEHSVEVLERADRRSRPSRTVCRVGTELRFNKGALERCSNTPLEELDVDLLTVLASVAFADRRLSRRSGRRWSRSIAVSVPVHHPKVWEGVSSSLASLLADVSGDQWRFAYRRRKDDDELRQLFLPRLGPEHRGSTVIPYSGGLDSFAALARHRSEHGDAPVLLVHAQHGARSLHAVLPERHRSAPALAVPFTVSGGRHAEPSYRTRTLVFFALAALAWRRTSASRIWIGESGLGCIGPSFVPFGIEQPVRGSHPSFVGKLQDFLMLLWGTRPPFEFPHLWLTKGEAVRQLSASGNLVDWDRTHSCSRNIRRQHPTTAATHCGLCSGCLFRRQSLLAAGLREASSVYYTDVLRDADLPSDVQRADREVATYAVIDLDELAGAAPTAAQQGGHIAELAGSLGRMRTEIAPKVSRLFAAHASEWRALVDALPAGSWMRKLLPSRERSG
jgi:7-cyano-7-deazaguanine synthase in queuosine biosynthesis